jgi:hypothetical protein
MGIMKKTRNYGGKRGIMGGGKRGIYQFTADPLRHVCFYSERHKQLIQSQFSYFCFTLDTAHWVLARCREIM